MLCEKENIRWDTFEVIVNLKKLHYLWTRDWEYIDIYSNVKIVWIFLLMQIFINIFKRLRNLKWVFEQYLYNA